ncbi:MAG: hydrogen peroxide-inducible genes activator [Pseudomonadales bacterium]|jgi:LysR family transcriptional regulator, hydrogen peroxide-inducible genes activator|nr:hydrogen peroxide-inducible genes activator [Pseudomonadales bacterium]
MHLPPIRQLQYLVALRDTEHFGNAAKQVNVTQSTLSTGIKELERALGVTLVERTNKSVCFTALGRQIADRSRYIIMQAEDLVDNARSLSDPTSIPVKLGVIPTIAPYLVSQYVIAIREAFESLKLYIREDTSARLIQELFDNKLDLALLALPYEAGQIQTRALYREGMHLAYHRNTRLLTASAEDFDALPDESLLLLDDGHCLRDHALAGCRLKNHKKIHTFGANSLQMLLQMVDNDLGVTLIPDMAVEAGVLQGTNIATERLPIERFYRDIGFAWRKGTSREDLLEEMLTLLPVKNPPSV